MFRLTLICVLTFVGGGNRKERFCSIFIGLSLLLLSACVIFFFEVLGFDLNCVFFKIWTIILTRHLGRNKLRRNGEVRPPSFCSNPTFVIIVCRVEKLRRQEEKIKELVQTTWHWRNEYLLDLIRFFPSYNGNQLKRQILNNREIST